MSPRLLWPFPPMWGFVGWSGQQSWYTDAEHLLHSRGNWASQHLSLCPDSKCWLSRAVTAAGPMSPSSQGATCLNSWIPCSGSRQGWRHIAIADQSHKLFFKKKPRLNSVVAVAIPDSKGRLQWEGRQKSPTQAQIKSSFLFPLDRLLC